MRRVVFVPIALVLAWWAISVTRSLPSSTEAGRDPAEKPQTPVQSQTPVQATPAATQVSGVEMGRDIMVQPFQFQKELTTYLDLQTKVFLNDVEKREREDLLHNTLLIRALGARLKVASRSMEVMREQDAAIDLILEALKEGDKTAAAEVLREVVQDGQVEDAKMEKTAREQLAGLKAEVLYQWSATNPQIASNLQTWLPGPVSKKIWDNVVRMQQSNAAESAAEGRAASH
ncbi:MAG: hypothetical protein KF799_09420 [Bdellovibrionales bacterium]|nr:hypothetical protein [Bdellovibrionales bacterium]